MRKNIFNTAIATAVTSVLASPALWAAKMDIGAGEGAVDIVAWPGYIERGDTDPNFNWVTDFEKKTGCEVRIKTANTSDEMVALMNEGGFDLVTASGDASLRLIAGGRVQEINPDLVPSWKRIDERLQNAPWHTVGGKHYGVPYQWGSNVLMYNTEAFKQPPQSWNVVFEEMTLDDGKFNKGRIQAFDGLVRRRTATGAVDFLGHGFVQRVIDERRFARARYACNAGHQADGYRCVD